jgi:hypothetical protein
MTPEESQQFSELQRRITKLEKKTTYPIEIEFQKAIENARFDLLQTKALRGPIYAGTNSSLPAGWTIANGSTGHYTITHNLDTSAYSVVAISYHGSGGGNIVIKSLSSTAFTLGIYNEAGTDWINSAFSFIVVKQ